MWWWLSMKIPWTNFFLSICPALVPALTKSLHLSNLQTSSMQDIEGDLISTWLGSDKDKQALNVKWRQDSYWSDPHLHFGQIQNAKPTLIFAISSSYTDHLPLWKGSETKETGSQWEKTPQWAMRTTGLFHSLLFQEGPVAHGTQ